MTIRTDPMLNLFSMQSKTRQFPVLSLLLWCLLAVAIWFVFAPTQLGGQVTYVIVDGISMESKFHLGDLVVVRKARNYEIGDAVTYRNAELGRFVFHRIIAQNLDHFVLQGDNNSWTDSYHPTQEEIVGKLWVHIPKLGKAIEWIRLPIPLAIAVSLLGGSLMYEMIRPTKKKKRHGTSPVYLNNTSAWVIYLLGFFTLIFLGLSIFAFTRPVTSKTDNISYQQEGNFFYSAAGAPDIYDTDQVRSGEPIFPKLTCYLNVGFAYNLAAPQLQGVTGSQQLYARVLDERSGWQRTLPMTSTNIFYGNSFLATSTLDLCQVQQLVKIVEQETGLHENIYTLQIVAQVALTAQAADNRVSDSFDPALNLKFDDIHFYLATGSGGEDPLQFSKQGMIPGVSSPANTMSLLGFHPSVLAVRVIGFAGLLITLILLLSLSWSVYSQTQENQSSIIRLKYGSLILDVQEHGFETLAPVMDVNTIDDLARMAERQNTMILHSTPNFMDCYLVQTQGMTYRYIAHRVEKEIVELASPSRSIMQSPRGTNSRRDMHEYNHVSDFHDIVTTQAGPISYADPTRKIILKYALTLDSNSELHSNQL